MGGCAAMARRGGCVALTGKTVPDHVEKVNAILNILHIHVNFVIAESAYPLHLRAALGEEMDRGIRSEAGEDREDRLA